MKILGYCIFAAGIAVASVAPADDAATELANFESQYSIKAWPRLLGCGYESPFEGKAVGVILNVQSSGRAFGRDNGCRGLLNHDLTGLPGGLERGRYVMAVTSAGAERDSPGSRDAPHLNRSLKVLGVQGSRPDDETRLAAALSRICAGGGSGAKGDAGCRRMGERSGN
jgi:hypothetical protein